MKYNFTVTIDIKGVQPDAKTLKDIAASIQGSLQEINDCVGLAEYEDETWSSDKKIVVKVG